MKRLSLALALLVAGAAACRKKPRVPQVAAATPASAPTSAAQQITTAPEPLPAWTQQPPALIMDGNRRVAVAVGMARADNEALARAAAEDRARASIARLLEGKSSTASVEMAVTGARIVQTYTAADGRVFVQLEAPAHR